jgi:hypothetical protein
VIVDVGPRSSRSGCTGRLRWRGSSHRGRARPAESKRSCHSRRVLRRPGPRRWPGHLRGRRPRRPRGQRLVQGPSAGGPDDPVGAQDPSGLHLGDLASGHADPEAVVTLAERGPHRAAPCRPSALSSPLATPAPPRPLLNQSSGRNRPPAEDRANHVTPSYCFRPRVAPGVRAACAASVTDYQADNSHSTDIIGLTVITVRYHFLQPLGFTPRSQRHHLQPSVGCT